MRMYARPFPVLRPLNQPRANRVKADISKGVIEVRFVHHNRAKPPPPKMSSPLISRVDPRRIPPVGIGYTSSQSVFVGGVDNKVNMIWHQAPCPDFTFVIFVWPRGACQDRRSNHHRQRKLARAYYHAGSHGGAIRE